MQRRANNSQENRFLLTLFWFTQRLPDLMYFAILCSCCNIEHIHPLLTIQLNNSATLYLESELMLSVGH